MQINELTREEKLRRQALVEKTREMILSSLRVEAEDEYSMMLGYRDFYLQISFSDVHPLMVLVLARTLDRPQVQICANKLNELNLQSILGCHAINEEAGCYCYRATQWLNEALEAPRFFEILNRCVEEADFGYYRI